MKFHVEGPFELPRKDSGLIDSSPESKREYWEGIEESCPGLPDACGCYVFTVIASRGSLPWYVGKVEKRTFRKESLAHHKLTHFNTVISERKGKPALFFLPQVTATTGKYSKSKSSESRAIRELESWLIGMALNRNEKLRNVAGTRWAGQLKVTGFLNDRKSKGGPAKKLRDLFNT